MRAILVLVCALRALSGGLECHAAASEDIQPPRMSLKQGWRLQSTVLVKPEGDAVSTAAFPVDGWYGTTVPSTVLSALTKSGVYPDVRVGLNSFRIPDASDDFNRQHDLAKYSHLPDKRNPWKDPYWYRTEFTLPPASRHERVWLCFDGIHYRADLWLNGQRIADARQVAGSFSRYRFDITGQVKFDAKNCLAVKIHQMDHPGTPETQLDLFGKDRNYHKEGMQDVGLAMFIGYDCMPTVPDRNLGLWQDVYLEFTGAVDLRHPFVTSQLPLPQTNSARLTVQVELVNATGAPQEGVLRGTIEETGGQLSKKVELSPGENKTVILSAGEFPALLVKEPRLWWPKNYGPQNLYHLALRFQGNSQVSDADRVTFGIRQVTKELHQLDGAHGLRLHVNGQKIFCRGGYLQPEVLFDWDAKRMEAEIRYLTEANINLVYFEDIPNPPDVFLDLCDRYGLMFGNCFYGCYWMTPGSPHPLDLDLLARGSVDIIQRYRNHPSLVLYMAMNEGDTREEVYTRWRKEILDRDGTRLFIPSGSFPDDRKNVPAWIQPDTPTGMNDYPPKSYGWVEPAQYFRWVRENRNWMFMLESGCPSVPPMDSLRRFMPGWDAENDGSASYPLGPAWAHHDACHYFKPFDAAVRKLYGQPSNLEDYCAKAALATADQHRAMFEAANHRMWDITSGFSEWKLNACWPSVEWQLYDWYLRPLVSYFYVKKACEPLHVQLSPLDLAVSVVNNRLEPQRELEVRARVFDFASSRRWEKTVKVDVPANACREVFAIPRDAEAAPIYFVMLEIRDSSGNVVSNNGYWMTPNHAGDFTRLEELPTVRLKTDCRLQRQGAECVARVKVANPSNRIALLVHLVLTQGPRGEEVLPVLWDDNYFSLAPGESRQLDARFAAEDLGESPLALEVGGWNVESDCQASGLQASKSRVKANEPLLVTATIANTFLDGSKIGLYVDGHLVQSKRFWARAAAKATRPIRFELKLSEPGTHQVQIGDSRIAVVVE
jgi:exo-1,4-beta-D-glucosaminidase